MHSGEFSSYNELPASVRKLQQQCDRELEAAESTWWSMLDIDFGDSIPSAIKPEIGNTPGASEFPGNTES